MMPEERRMKIAICASMVFAEKMLEVKRQLEELAVHDKNEHDAIRKFWEIIKKSDAILVLNYDRKGIRNYIGGNTLMEIGFAHVLNKPIFLMNPIPDIEYYRSEIEAVSPVILEQNLNLIM
jgi:nucleoside 2-deoxyribosyltransferase